MADNQLRNTDFTQVGEAADMIVTLDGDAGQNKELQFMTGGVKRAVLRTEDTAEAGSDAGSDVELEVYDDSGVSVATALSIDRATGDVSIGQALSVAGPMVNPFQTFTGDDATPSVAAGRNFKCAADNTSPLTITALDGAVAGQEVMIVGADDTNTTTINKAAGFKMTADHTLGVGDVLTLVYDGTAWHEKSFATNLTS